MPKIWLDYAHFLAQTQCEVSKAREVYDRALVALPITQHELVWTQYADWAQSLVPEEEGPAKDLALQVARTVLRRYIKLKQEATEDYIEFLLKHNVLEEALALYVEIIEDERFVSNKGKTKFQLRMELCEFLAKNPLRSEGISTYLSRSLSVPSII
eukprot:CAMPEP_0202968926 /NCGR_PEP_ID=MMETSP1396-20130829/14458_1 /ASSEMBLY_ACC=CAM_ASM_000872 /TAXON_ID= /ORGANISM="Pseudokeronopsis sp., Strain Brazil" /LENGTH=155 /DNA_ID=CAMNT_0049695857 /DNA_START=282 /DNA_END=746 /DNA_ORIENTATION=+